MLKNKNNFEIINSFFFFFQFLGRGLFRPPSYVHRNVFRFSNSLLLRTPMLSKTHTITEPNSGVIVTFSSCVQLSPKMVSSLRISTQIYCAFFIFPYVLHVLSVSSVLIIWLKCHFVNGTFHIF